MNWQSEKKTGKRRLRVITAGYRQSLPLTLPVQVRVPCLTTTKKVSSVNKKPRQSKLSGLFNTWYVCLMRPKNSSLSAGYIRYRSFFIAKAPDADMNRASARFISCERWLVGQNPSCEECQEGVLSLKVIFPSCPE